MDGRNHIGCRYGVNMFFGPKAIGLGDGSQRTAQTHRTSPVLSPARTSALTAHPGLSRLSLQGGNYLGWPRGVGYALGGQVTVSRPAGMPAIEAVRKETQSGLQEGPERGRLHLHLYLLQQEGRLLRLHSIPSQEPAASGMLLPAGGGEDLRPQFHRVRQGVETLEIADCRRLAIGRVLVGCPTTAAFRTERRLPDWGCTLS